MNKDFSKIRHLDPEHVAGFVPSHPVDLQVLRGRVWVTEEGCLDDRLLEAGSQMRLDCGNEVVIQAVLASADVQIRSVKPESTVSSSLRNWIADGMRQLTALRTRLHLGRCDTRAFAR